MSHLKKKIIKIIKKDFKKTQEDLLINVYETIEKIESTEQHNFELSNLFREYSVENEEVILNLDLALRYKFLFKREFNLKINKRQFKDLIEFIKSDTTERPLKILSLFESVRDSDEFHAFLEDKNSNQFKNEKKDISHIYL